GTVTSADMASLGIFVLDGKLRLVTASTCMATVKKHSRISVYNAHIVKDDGQAYLVCCMRSCIRIHESVSSVTDSMSHLLLMRSELVNFMKKLIRKYGLNLKEILALQQLYNILSGQERSESCREKLFAQFVKSDICANLTYSGVNAADLFIFHEQLCPFNQSKKEESRIPQIIGLNALKNEVTSIKSNFDSTSVLNYPGMKIQSLPHHFKVCFSSAKVLVGCIMTCSEGTVFRDSTSNFRLVILSDSGVSHADSDSNHTDLEIKGDPSGCCKDTTDQHSQPHLCCQRCFGHCQPGKQLTCPVLDPWLVGAIICVTKFHVVLEGDFDTRSSDASKSGIENNGHLCIYLVFSLLDCVLLDNVENSSPTLAGSERGLMSDLLPASQSTNERLTRKAKHQQESSCCIFVHEKQPLTYTGNMFDNGKFCQFQLLGCKIDVDLYTENNIRCCENTCVRRKKSTFTTSSELVAESQKNILQDSHQERPESICASFINSAAKWYSCFTSGHLYKLTTSSSSSDPEPFKQKLLKVLPQKVTECYNVQMNIEVPEDLFVERLPRTSDLCCGLHVGVLHSIREIIFSETVVSFKGIIVGRYCEASFNSNMKTSGRMSSPMINIKLEIRDMLPNTADIDCGRTITVYLDAPKTVYTLGLVPGAVVNLHRVERKVSRAGNVYCRFIAVSLAEVVQFLDLGDAARCTSSQTPTVNMDSLPRELLFNMRQYSTEDRHTEKRMFLISCHIEKIFSLRIKTVCSSCKSIFSKTGCQSRDCSSATWPVTVASTVLLVNDGTCPATVKIWDSNLICRLLTLTQSQWEDLVTEVTSHGEVVLDNSSPPTSSISTFLQELISSPLVLRPCMMAVRIYRGSVSSVVDKMRLEDFQENEVKVGKHYLKTLSLPRMQLDCLSISEIR
ncbi:unnamed protein product, partial [Candidula unifasciata]